MQESWQYKHHHQQQKTQWKKKKNKPNNLLNHSWMCTHTYEKTPMLIKAASETSALGMCNSTTCLEHPLEIFPSGVARLTHCSILVISTPTD